MAIAEGKGCFKTWIRAAAAVAGLRDVNWVRVRIRDSVIFRGSFMVLTKRGVTINHRGRVLPGADIHIRAR